MFIAAWSTGTHCAEPAAEPPGDWMLARVSNAANEGSTREAVEQRMLHQYREIDYDANGISEADYEFSVRKAQAALRAQLISLWSIQDLDGDGQVTRAELEAFETALATRPLRASGGVDVDPSPEQTKAIRDELVTKALVADEDANGIVTYSEILKYAKGKTPDSAGQRQYNKIPWSLDADKDGVISRAEYVAQIDTVFAHFDRNSDGKLSGEELVALRNDARTAQQRAQTEKLAEIERNRRQRAVAACEFPKLLPAEQIVVVGAYEGQALSDVALGGEDRPISVSDIHIERGRRKVSIFLTSYSGQIWRFSGAVDRVTHVWATALTSDPAHRPRVGVIGLKAKTVTLAPSANCLRNFHDAQSSEASDAIQTIKDIAGRVPDKVVAADGIARVDIPGGTVTNSPYPDVLEVARSGASADIWNAFSRYNPGGVVRIDPSRVVARTAIAKFTVLPQEAGLAQLVDAGALELVGTTNVVTLGSTTIEGNATVIAPDGSKPVISKRPSRYVIRKKMTFPAGLTGAHAVDFVLPAGVPEPDGDPGHSNVIREE